MTPRRTRLAIVAGAVAATLAACGGGGGGGHDGDAERGPSAAALVGSYDVRVTGDSGGPSFGIGTIRGDAPLSLGLTEPPAELTGSLRDDGTALFTGHSTQTDAISTVELAGKFEVRDGTIHFVGVLGTEVPSPLDLVMERPQDADLRRFGGSRRLRFERGPSYCDCSSSMGLDVSVDAAGLATVTATSETRDDGSELGRLSFLGISVAPSGRFQLEATYARLDGKCPLDMIAPCLLVVDGMLAADDAVSAVSATLLSGVRMPIWRGTATIARAGD